MSAATGLGLLDVMILEAIATAGARHDQSYVKTQRALDVLHERTGIVASAPMLDGHERGRATVTITALPPFTSASRIADLVQNAVMHHGRGRPGRPSSVDDDAPSPVSDVNDGSAGGRTQLVVVGRSGSSHADVRRFLDRIPTVHQRVEIEFERPLATLVRDVATPEDLGYRIDLIDETIGP